jgi:hypothetical protein
VAFGLAIGMAVLIFLLFFKFQDSSAKHVQEVPNLVQEIPSARDRWAAVVLSLLFLMLFIAVVLIVYFCVYVSTHPAPPAPPNPWTRCPSCQAPEARVFVGKELVRRCLAYTTVTRRDRLSGGGMAYGLGTGKLSFGSMSGVRNREEQIRVQRSFYEIHFRCKFCQHAWVKQKVEDSDDFEVD